MSTAQQSCIPIGHRLDAIRTRWQGLIVRICNPYRPELHYMRGTGPKWYAKHQGRTENDRSQPTDCWE